LKDYKISGNSIVLVSILQNGFEKEIIRTQFKKLNCTSEGLNDFYFSIEILKDTNHLAIKKILIEYGKSGILEYLKPCLSKKYQTI